MLTSNLVANSFTWSISGATPITYSLTAYESNPIPSWATLDTANQELVVNPPDSEENTTHQFYINSQVAAVDYKRLITINVGQGKFNKV